MDTELDDLMQIFSIDPNQLKVGKGQVSVKFPDYFHDLKIEVQEHMIDVLVWNDYRDDYWMLDGECLQLLFNTYKIVPSYQKVDRQLGNCNYHKQRIRLNFGNSGFDKAQCRKTLIHEYVHAITKEFYNYSGHGELFKFYNNVLQYAYKKRYIQKSTKEFKMRFNVKT